MRWIWLWILTIPPAAAQPVSLSLSRAWSEGPSVTFYLNPRGPGGLPVKLENAAVSAAAGGLEMKAAEVKGFVASGEAQRARPAPPGYKKHRNVSRRGRAPSCAYSSKRVAYLVLADISKSIRPAQFEGMRKAMANFASGLRKVDRMALITFGGDVRVALDFTADREKIRKELDALEATASRTKLHLALSRALELGQETSLEARQFELSLSTGRVVIRDLSGNGATSVNGVPIRGLHPLSSGDVIGAGGADFRLLIGKP